MHLDSSAQAPARADRGLRIAVRERGSLARESFALPVRVLCFPQVPLPRCQGLPSRQRRGKTYQGPSTCSSALRLRFYGSQNLRTLLGY